MRCIKPRTSFIFIAEKDHVKGVPGPGALGRLHLPLAITLSRSPGFRQPHGKPIFT